MTGIQVQRDCGIAWASSYPDLQLGAGLAPAALLQLIDALEPAAATPREPDHEPDSDLVRLERKLDTVLQLVAMLNAGGGHGPTPTAVTLSPTELRWTTASPGAPANGGDDLLVWLSPLAPAPLRFAGEHCTPGSDVHSFQLVFSDVDMESAWARLLFRWHRRAIARKR